RETTETFRNYFVGADSEPDEIEREELARILDDDFNTPDALALFHDWRARRRTASLRWGLELFGLGGLAEQVPAPSELVALAERRESARAKRDFDEADRLRGEIESQGWEVRDVENGFELVPKGPVSRATGADRAARRSAGRANCSSSESRSAPQTRRSSCGRRVPV